MEVVVPDRLIHLLLLAASLYASGAAIVALSNGALRSPGEATAVNKPTASPAVNTIDATAILLPVVVVHPEPEVPTLATVTVRASRAERVQAIADAGEIPASPLLPAARRTAVLSFAGGGFDMPYYSFGRTLRHASKE
jgi:hypothetical protein